MVERRAFAHRLHGRRCAVVGAKSECQQRLDLAGAAAARRRSLGAGTHRVQRGQAVLGDGGQHAALADAVAAAHLGGVGQRLDARRRRRSGQGGAEHQQVAHGGDVGALADQVEVPAPVAGVAIQHRADQQVAAQYQPLVDAARHVAEHDLLRALVAGEVAGGEHIDAGDLQPGAGDGGLVGAVGDPGDLVGADLGHVPDRRHQAEHLATVLHALAHREDAHVAGAHRVIDPNAAPDRQAGGAGQRHVGTDARRHDHQIGRQFPAVRQLQRRDPILAQQRAGVGAGHHADAAGCQVGCQQLARERVELAVHQGGRQMHDGHVHAAAPQPMRRLQPEQAAADHHRTAARRQHRVDVGNIAEGDHAGQVGTRYRRHERHRAGRQQQHVVGTLGAMRAHHAASVAVDCGNRLAGNQLDALVRVPVAVMGHDVLELLLPGQHRREHDPVVVAVRLGAEHGDVERAGRAGDDLLQRADAGHAVANQHQAAADRRDHVHVAVSLRPAPRRAVPTRWSASGGAPG